MERKVMIYRILWSALRLDAATKAGLVDVITLEDHKSALADAQATVEALQRERDEWRSNAVAQEARANDLERDCKDLQSDIEDERAKAGNLSKKIAYWEKRHRTYKELAEENMNCKQASIDAHKDAYDELESQHAALDAEREKVKGLHEITKVICTHCCEPMEIPSKAVLQTQLTQLQALVRALFEFKCEDRPEQFSKENPMYEEGDETCPFFTEAYLYVLLGKEDARSLLAITKPLRPTLATTTPATPTHNGGA